MTTLFRKFGSACKLAAAGGMPYLPACSQAVLLSVSEAV